MNVRPSLIVGLLASLLVLLFIALSPRLANLRAQWAGSSGPVWTTTRVMPQKSDTARGISLPPTVQPSKTSLATPVRLEAATDTSVTILPISMLAAADMAQTLKEFLQTEKEGRMRIVAEPVTNALLVMADKKDTEKIKNIVAQLEELAKQKAEPKQEKKGAS